MHRQEGFTLIELMIVILIIGILVGIAVPVFLAARGSADEKTCMANRRTIKGASNIYAASNDGIYPPFAAAEWRPALDGYVEKITTITCPTAGDDRWGVQSTSREVPLNITCDTHPDI